MGLPKYAPRFSDTTDYLVCFASRLAEEFGLDATRRAKLISFAETIGGNQRSTSLAAVAAGVLSINEAREYLRNPHRVVVMGEGMRLKEYAA